MYSVTELEKNVISSQDLTSRELSPDELSSGWSSRDVDDSISDESSAPDSIYEDFYFRTRNYWIRRNSVKCKAILDRAYNFVYDEIFSSETDAESDFSIDNFSPTIGRARNPVAGDGDDFCSIKKLEKLNNRFCDEYMQSKLRGGVEVSNFKRLRQQNSTRNLESSKSQLSPRIFAEKMQKYEESFFRNRNTSRIRSAENCAKSVSDSSDFLSEISNFDEPFGNLQSRNFFSKKSSMRGKRKFSSTEFQDRFNYSEKGARRKNSGIYKAENSLTRISQSSNLVSKMRRIYSEQIFIEKLRGENNETLLPELGNSSSDDSFAIDVEEILQENLRGKKTRLTVETVLLENKNEKGSKFLQSVTNPGRISDCFTSDTQENEVKLLGDIKKRIDDDFNCDLREIRAAEGLIESPELNEGGERCSNIDSRESLKIVSSLESNCSKENLEKGRIFNENRKSLSLDRVSESIAKKNEIINSYSINTSTKSSRQYFVDSIDSGVSTDFSPNESDLSRNDRCLKIDHKIENPNSPEDEERHLKLEIVTSSNHSDADDEEVEKAVQKFTEELIMCERRAVERGLDGAENRRKKSAAVRKRRKSFRQIRYSSSPKSCNTLRSPREFSKTSQSSSEEEYLENISPPSLCSISDSDEGNLYDFNDCI